MALRIAALSLHLHKVHVLFHDSSCFAGSHMQIAMLRDLLQQTTKYMGMPGVEQQLMGLLSTSASECVQESKCVHRREKSMRVVPGQSGS